MKWIQKVSNTLSCHFLHYEAISFCETGACMVINVMYPSVHFGIWNDKPFTGVVWLLGDNQYFAILNGVCRKQKQAMSIVAQFNSTAFLSLLYQALARTFHN